MIVWRAMTALDLPMVETIAGIVHPAFPEDGAIFAERLALYPQGTRMLEVDGVAAGYILSHPWRLRQIPALDALIGQVPDDADTYYIHDLALLNAVRGTGAAAMIVGEILRHASAKGLPSVSLVAVNGSLPFWYKHGFRVVAAPELADTLAGYEAAARYMSKALV